MGNYFIDAKSQKLNTDDMKQAKADQMDAFQRRIDAIRDNGGGIMPYVKERAAEFNLRRVEGNQTGDPYNALMGNTPQAKNRAALLDQEAAAAQKQYDQNQESPNG